MQKRRRLHDLAALAVAALRDIAFAPSLLNRMFALGVKAFDCSDFLARNGAHRCDATALGFAINVHRAGTAEPRTASEFGTRHVEEIPHIPEHWHLWVTVELPVDSIDLQLDHDFSRYSSWKDTTLMTRGVHPL